METPKDKEISKRSIGLTIDVVGRLGDILKPSNFSYDKKETRKLLKGFLNNYFKVNENGQLEIKSEELNRGDTLLEIKVGEGYLSLYGKNTKEDLPNKEERENPINIRKGFRISFDKDETENLGKPVFRVYLARRLNNPYSDNEKGQADILGDFIGCIKYEDKDKFQWKRPKNEKLKNEY